MFHCSGPKEPLKVKLANSYKVKESIIFYMSSPNGFLTIQNLNFLSHQHIFKFDYNLVTFY